jgi:hypothetical protein
MARSPRSRQLARHSSQRPGADRHNDAESEARSPRCADFRARADGEARRRPTRSTKVLLADTAERMLAEGDGVTTGELAEQARADRDQVLTLLRDLEAARRVRWTGQRRATRWHAITDEDRIRERAAELASRSRRRRT